MAQRFPSPERRTYTVSFGMFGPLVYDHRDETGAEIIVRAPQRPQNLPFPANLRRRGRRHELPNEAPRPYRSPPRPSENAEQLERRRDRQSLRDMELIAMYADSDHGETSPDNSEVFSDDENQPPERPASEATTEDLQLSEGTSDEEMYNPPSSAESVSARSSMSVNEEHGAFVARQDLVSSESALRGLQEDEETAKEGQRLMKDLYSDQEIADGLPDQPLPTVSHAAPGFESGLCVFCCTSVRHIMFSPCRHLVACFDCGRRLFKEKPYPNCCPMCRVPILDIYKVFL